MTRIVFITILLNNLNQLNREKKMNKIFGTKKIIMVTVLASIQSKIEEKVAAAALRGYYPQVMKDVEDRLIALTDVVQYDFDGNVVTFTIAGVVEEIIGLYVFKANKQQAEWDAAFEAVGL